jgi:HSP20 family protein
MEVDSVLSELQEMKHRMEELYSQSMGRQEDPCGNENQDSESSTDRWEPLADVWETEISWIVELDLPGVSEDSLQVEVKDKELSIRGERRAASRNTVLKITQSERLWGPFSRIFRLPTDVRPERIQAGLKGGVLTLTIPKLEKAKTSPHKIEVRAE